MKESRVHQECRACGSDNTTYREIPLKGISLRKGVVDMGLYICESCNDYRLVGNIEDTKKARREINRLKHIAENGMKSASARENIMLFGALNDTD